RVLEDDQIFLHLQERLLEKSEARTYAQACYLPTQADRYVIAFRKWVNQFGADPFPGQALPPEQGLDALMDRYHSHTQHCGSCLTALKRIQQIRQGLLVVCAVLWSLVPVMATVASLSILSSLLLAGVPLLAVAVWLYLGGLEEKFYKGDPIPPRNLG
ncbi:MAG: cell death suppressor protein Lls1, partial [Cyanobacteria bacterium P01_A01_bin.105]